MKSEREMIEDKLAYVRDNIFDETDFISDDGYDLLGAYVGNPYEVLCGMEQKIQRQQKKIEWLEERLSNAIFDDVYGGPTPKKNI